MEQPEVIEVSKNEARQLRMEAYNDEHGRIPFPVDPFTVAENLGINVEIVPLDPDTAGFILKESFERAKQQPRKSH